MADQELKTTETTEAALAKAIANYVKEHSEELREQCQNKESGKKFRGHDVEDLERVWRGFLVFCFVAGIVVLNHYGVIRF